MFLLFLQTLAQSAEMNNAAPCATAGPRSIRHHVPRIFIKSLLFDN